MLPLLPSHGCGVGDVRAVDASTPAPAPRPKAAAAEGVRDAGGHCGRELHAGAAVGGSCSRGRRPRRGRPPREGAARRAGAAGGRRAMHQKKDRGERSRRIGGQIEERDGEIFLEER